MNHKPAIPFSPLDKFMAWAAGALAAIRIMLNQVINRDDMKDPAHG